MSMNIIYWNIRGCNHPRKWKSIARKIKLEKHDILFLQEMKYNFETMEKIREKIWKGSNSVALNADEMAGGCTILWIPNVVDLTDWNATHFALIANFQHLSFGVKGSLMNIYGIDLGGYWWPPTYST